MNHTGWFKTRRKNFSYVITIERIFLIIQYGSQKPEFRNHGVPSIGEFGEVRKREDIL